jgi:uncharacterized protein (TIGR03437 family)
MGLAVDAKGSLYIADFSNNRVRKVSGGVMSTVAGNGSAGYSGDGGPAANAQLNLPQGVAVDAAGNLYIADTGNSVIRMVTPDGHISTLAGTGRNAGYSGDGGSALQALLGNPRAVAVDATGAVYIADSARIRKVLPAGVIVTVAGNGTTGYSGDAGPALSATFNAPASIAVNAAGTVYVADTGNNAVRSLQPVPSGMTLSAVTNGATNAAGPVAPGEVVVLYGAGLASDPLSQFQLTNSGLVPTTVAGTSVFFGTTPAPVLYVSSTQVGAIVPFNTGGSTVPVSVVYKNQNSNAVTVSVAAVSPAIFTLDGSGTGRAVAYNVTDGSLNGPDHPAKTGDYVTVYATGTGQTSPPGTDGLPASVPGLPGALPLPLPAVPVTATIGGKTAVVSYFGGAPGIVAGVTQVNLQIPAGLTAGQVNVVLHSGGVDSPAGITIAVSGN